MNTEGRLLMRIRHLEKMVVDLANSAATLEVGLDHVVSVANAFAFDLARVTSGMAPDPSIAMAQIWRKARDS